MMEHFVPDGSCVLQEDSASICTGSLKGLKYENDVNGFEMMNEDEWCSSIQ